MNALRECYTAVEYFSPVPRLNFDKRSTISSWSTKICSLLCLLLYLGLIAYKLFNWLTATPFTINYSLSTQPKTETIIVDKELINFEIYGIGEDEDITVNSADSVVNVDSHGKAKTIGESSISEDKMAIFIKMQEDMKLGGAYKLNEQFTAETSFSFVSSPKKEIDLVLNYETYFINQKNPSKPLDSVNSEQNFNISSDFDYKLKIKFVRVKLSFSLYVLVSMGFKEEYNFSFVRDMEIHQVPKANEGLTACYVMFDIANDEINYSIEYEQFDSVLAKINAVKNFVLAVGSVLLGLFNQGNYETYIADCCFSFSPGQNKIKVNNERENSVDLIDQTAKKRVKVSFCDSIRVFCFGKPRNSLSKRMFEAIANQFDVLEIVKRQIYIDILRRKQAEQSNSLSDSKDRSTANIY